MVIVEALFSDFAEGMRFYHDKLQVEFVDHVNEANVTLVVARSGRLRYQTLPQLPEILLHSPFVHFFNSAQKYPRPEIFVHRQGRSRTDVQQLHQFVSGLVLLGSDHVLLIHDRGKEGCLPHRLPIQHGNSLDLIRAHALNDEFMLALGHVVLLCSWSLFGRLLFANGSFLDERRLPWRTLS